MFEESESFQWVIFALAMNWNHARDVLRLRAMTLLRPGIRVISVNSYMHEGVYDKRHLAANFRDPKGRKDLLDRITIETRARPGARVSVLLDYFWLQGGYYSSNYGVDWLSDAAYQLIDGGATDVILPYDFGEKNKNKCDMVMMLDGRPNRGDLNYPAIGKPHMGIQVEFIPVEDNPLWVASESSEIAEAMASLKNLRTDNYSQTVDWLHPTTPFVLVSATSS